MMSLMFQASLGSSSSSSPVHEGSPKPKAKPPETQPPGDEKLRARVLVYCQEVNRSRFAKAIDASHIEVLVGCVDDFEDVKQELREKRVDVVVVDPGPDDDVEALARDLSVSTPIVAVESEREVTERESVHSKDSSRLPTQLTHLATQGLGAEIAAQKTVHTAFEAAADYRMWSGVAIRGALA